MIYQKYQKIYFIDNNNQHATLFNLLFKAIALVKKDYLTFIDDLTGEFLYHKERVFAYELYRQLANVLEREHETSLIINAEIDKIIGSDISYYEENLKPTVLRKYPDIVIHGGQNNRRKQKIICEIKHNTKKMVPSSDILADLYKLSLYIDKNEMGDKKYDYGVFILLNGHFKQIKDLKCKIIVNEEELSVKQFKLDKKNYSIE